MKGKSAALILARNLALERELVEILEALEGARVPCIVLKGIPMCRRLALPLEARIITDNDLLVRKADTHRAVRTLASLGYQSPRFWSLESALQTNFEYPLIRHRGAETWLAELHWAIAHPKLYPMDEEAVWQHRTITELGGRRIAVLDDAMSTVHLALHCAQHYFREERILREFAASVEKLGENPSALLRTAIEFELLPVVAATWNIAFSLGLLPRPPRLLETRRARAVTHVLARVEDSSDLWSWVLPLAALALARPARVPGFVMALAWVPSDHLAELIGHEPHGRLAWLSAYARRLVRIARRAS